MDDGVAVRVVVGDGVAVRVIVDDGVCVGLGVCVCVSDVVDVDDSDTLGVAVRVVVGDGVEVRVVVGDGVVVIEGDEVSEIEGVSDVVDLPHSPTGSHPVNGSHSITNASTPVKEYTLS